MNTENLTATQFLHFSEPSYIKSQIEYYKSVIQDYQAQIESLQEICSHRNKYSSTSEYEMFGKTLYSDNHICKDCGKIWSEKRERKN